MEKENREEYVKFAHHHSEVSGKYRTASLSPTNPIKKKKSTYFFKKSR